MNAKIDKLKDDMFMKVADFNPDTLALQDVTMRIGGKVCKLVVVENADIPGEKEIREEYITKIKERLKGIQEYLHQKMQETMSTVEAVKDEYTRKERVLEERLRNAAPMPDVTMDHARKGLTVTKAGNGELCWYVRGLYWPKRYNNREIEMSFSKKLMTPVIFTIRTKGNQVLNVSIRRVNDLEAFQHYHMMSSNNDCWGYWNWPKTWSEPNDLIRIAREAEAVLEKINGDSIAQENPRGLPMLGTLKNHLLEAKAAPAPAPKPRIDQELRRQGLDTPRPDVDMWSTD